MSGKRSSTADAELDVYLRETSEKLVQQMKQELADMQRGVLYELKETFGATSSEAARMIIAEGVFLYGSQSLLAFYAARYMLRRDDMKLRQQRDEFLKGLSSVFVEQASRYYDTALLKMPTNTGPGTLQ